MARTPSPPKYARFVLLASVCVIVAALYFAQEVLIPLALAMLLTLMVAIYLGSHARRMEQPRPEDRKDAEIADGAGELGFYPPYSWWPFYCALCFSTIVLGVVFGWWLFIIGLALGAVALSGWLFEYYRGEHAH